MITTKFGKISGVDRGSYTEYRSAAFLRRILHKGKTAYRTMPLVCLRYELNTTGKGRKCGLFLLLGWYLSKVILLGGYLSTAPKRDTLLSSPSLFNMNFNNFLLLLVKSSEMIMIIVRLDL